jgi:hypothetical protein
MDGQKSWRQSHQGIERHSAKSGTVEESQKMSTTAINPVLVDANNLLYSQDQQIKDLEAQLENATSGDWDAAFCELQVISQYSVDRKIPFQFFQAGNTGNTGGGSGAPHGTQTWTPGPGGTTVHWAPVVLPGGASDNAFTYSVLPTLPQAPKTLRWAVRNWACASPTDWSKSQQMEWQVEEFRDGYQYTCAAAANPRKGVFYWHGAKYWQPLMDANGVQVVYALDHPTPIDMEFTLDQTAHTYTLAKFKIADQTYAPNVVVPAVKVGGTSKQFSVAVQLDGQAAAPAYTAILDGLEVSVKY